MPMPIDAKELQQLADAATPGPWVYEYTRHGHTVLDRATYRAMAIVDRTENPEADCRLFALAPQLAAEVIRLTAELRRIAEGNLGDQPWQANYDRIREVAAAAIAPGGSMGCVGFVKPMEGC